MDSDPHPHQETTPTNPHPSPQQRVRVCDFTSLPLVWAYKIFFLKTLKVISSSPELRCHHHPSPSTTTKHPLTSSKVDPCLPLSIPPRSFSNFPLQPLIRSQLKIENSSPAAPDSQLPSAPTEDHHHPFTCHATLLQPRDRPCLPRQPLPRPSPAQAGMTSHPVFPLSSN